MCVDSSLLRFISEEKQLFISVLVSDCILSPTNGGRHLAHVVEGGLSV